MKKRKTRYGKFFARMLFASTLMLVICPLVIVMSFMSNGTDSLSMALVFFGLFAFFLLLLIFLTKRLNRRTPEQQRKATWFRAWRLGARVSLSGSLVLVRLITKGAVGSSGSISIPDEDYYEPHWYDDRRKVKANGIECKVGRSGDYIEMENKWVRVNRASNGDPYIEKDGEKIWLE